MRPNRLFLSLLFFSHFGINATAQETELQRVEDFGDNPGNLKMFVYDVHQKSDTSLMPLVVVLHGCGQTAAEVARLTGWNKLATEHHFIVLYPQQKILNNVSACFNWFNKADINKGRGECESIYRQVLYMQKNYRVDTNRIFITGVSAGGAMAVVMIATHPELFKSGAIFAGGAYKLATNVFASATVMTGSKKMSAEELVTRVTDQNPGYEGKYPSIIIYQGMNDPLVNHKNADLLIEQWAGLHHCDTTADLTQDAFAGVADIKRMEYDDNSGEPVIIYYEIKNMGHRILVKPGDEADEGGKAGTFGMDKGFYSIYQTAKDFGLVCE